LGREGAIPSHQTSSGWKSLGLLAQCLWPRSRIRAGAFGLTLACCAPVQAQQQAQDTIRNTYGEVGLLDMPSAHMAPDGRFGVEMGDIGNYQRYSFYFQRWPWLETSFRYSRVPYWGGQRVYYDRSFGAKVRLFDERDDLADVSLGIRDALGTGIYGAEYIVASKHIGPLDITAGLGWGRLSDNNVMPNPFGKLISSFNTRKPASGLGGVVDFGEFFHGPETGVFGGVAWQTPIDNLSVLAEYSSDKYEGEGAFKGGLRVRSPANVGLSYRPLESFAVSAGWFYGTTYGFTVSVSADPTTTFPSALRIGPKVPPAVIRSDSQQQSALATMHERNDRAGSGVAGGAWVEVPSAASREKQDLLQAFYSETHGVRDIEFDGKSLVIDAHATDDPAAQCASFAQIASASGAPTTTLAMTDLQNPEGLVTFCPIAGPTAMNTGRRRPGPADLGRPDQTALTRTVRAAMVAQSLQLDAISLGTSELWIYYENYRYNNESEAAGRVIRLLMADAPPSVEIFHLILAQFGVPMREITVTRSSLERAISNSDSASSLGEAIALSAPPLDSPILDRAAHNLYPRFAWSLDPKLTQRLFDPDSPLQFLVYGDATAALQLSPGLILAAEGTATIWTNYTYNRPPDSVLPHVRTDILQYLKHGKYGISNLQLIYRTRLARDVFAEARGGYLEDMYMGAGGQILWRPEHSRFAFGADIYQVWKRDFDRLFGDQSYNILTGHVSVYYASPWYGVNYAVHVGRYLAGDYGGTIEITRRFNSGVEIGAWATFTNVPFHKFGEGSFDKGLIIHIPFEWGLPIYSQSSYDLRLASLTRDGGQRLAGDDSLYGLTRGTSYGDISDHIDEIINP
jgi:Exopolysaccharide biosynthesis protein YbjH